MNNYIFLISSQRDISLGNYHNDRFKRGRPFLFFGQFLPQEPGKAAQGRQYFIKTIINGSAFELLQGKTCVNVFLYPIEKITTYIREYLAIRNLKFHQEISQMIYHPDKFLKNDVYISNPEIYKQFFQILPRRFNQSQIKSIKAICLIKKGLCLLQGPPGTGKTHTLLGLVSGLLMNLNAELKEKILICAPSNAAIDEVITRIVENGLISEIDTRLSVKVVRVGILDKNPSRCVKESSLEFQAQQQLMRVTGFSQDEKTQAELKLELVDVSDKICKLTRTKRIDDLSAKEKSEFNKLMQERRYLVDKIAEFKVKKKQNKEMYQKILNQLLDEAVIVCSTLSSSGTEKLKYIGGQIQVVIVDEAAQSTEPTTLIPFLYNPQKIVLIGDPKQLPATTFSPTSNVTKYNRSLFERILDNNLPPYFLKIQYRMHPNIREFPSRAFYYNKLKDDDSISGRQFPAYLQFFNGHNNVQFIDIPFSRQKRVDKSYENQLEADIVIKILKRLSTGIYKQAPGDVVSIGVITPYKQQCKVIKLILRQLSDFQQLQKHVQINTVDSFQGQEKDIIIFSTVRASQSEDAQNLIGFLQDERRMNVALTRAKFVLIIVGNAQTLCTNLRWSQLLDFISTKNGYTRVDDQQDNKDFMHQYFSNSLPKSQRVYVKSERAAKEEEGTLRAEFFNIEGLGDNDQAREITAETVQLQQQQQREEDQKKLQTAVQKELELDAIEIEKQKKIQQELQQFEDQNKMLDIEDVQKDSRAQFFEEYRSMGGIASLITKKSEEDPMPAPKEANASDKKPGDKKPSDKKPGEQHAKHKKRKDHTKTHKPGHRHKHSDSESSDLFQ